MPGGSPSSPCVTGVDFAAPTGIIGGVKRALSTAEYDLSLGPEFSVDVAEPGKIVLVRTVFRPKKLIVRMAQPPLVPMLQIVFLVDPEAKAPKRTRRFVVMPERTVISCDHDDELTVVGVAGDVSSDGIVAVFEANAIPQAVL